MNVQMFLSFLADLVKRFVAPTPKFFTILRNISGLLTLVIGLPAFIEGAGFTLPDVIHDISSKTFGIITLTIFFISQLTVEDRNNLDIK